MSEPSDDITHAKDLAPNQTLSSDASIDSHLVVGQENIHTAQPHDSELLWRAWQELDFKDENELLQKYQEFAQLAARCGESPTAIETSESKHSLTRPRSASVSKIERLASDYQYTCVPEPITYKFVKDSIHLLRHGGHIPVNIVADLIDKAIVMCSAEPNIPRIPIKKRVTVVGDIHGQLSDLLNVFRLNGHPAARNQYVFNGDYVDRGEQSVEVMLVLIMNKLLHGENVCLNRGNHEAQDINTRDGFAAECAEKYDIDILNKFHDLFAALPIASVVADKVFVVHGGLFWEDVTLAQLDALDRFQRIPEHGSLLEQMLWSDPMEEIGRSENRRGAGLMFGPDVTTRFLSINGLELIIRSHECKRKGYSRKQQGHVLTIFSASNYTGTVGNDGAFVVLEQDKLPLIIPYFTNGEVALDGQTLNLRKNIVERLVLRIAAHRLPLIDFYMKVEDKATSTVTHQQWLDGLTTVLQLNIPFERFQEQLGVPLIGVDGTSRGPVDYLTFLSRFKPAHQLINRSFWKKRRTRRRKARHEQRRQLQNARLEPPSERATPVTSPGSYMSDAAEEARMAQQLVAEQLTSILFEHRYALESLFRYFDRTGLGCITTEEFRDGMQALRTVLDFELNDEMIQVIANQLDSDKDDVINYKEFCHSFTIPQLAATRTEEKDASPTSTEILSANALDECAAEESMEVVSESEDGERISRSPSFGSCLSNCDEEYFDSPSSSRSPSPITI